MKRFYKIASVAETDECFAVMLDGRTVKTPAGAPLALSRRAAADLIAAEWAAQADQVRPHTMPLTRLVNVALDRTPAAREGVAAEVAKYGETDAVCHLAEGPEALLARQQAQWSPIREWAAAELGVRLEAVCGVVAGVQPPESLERLRTLALALDDLRLTALAHATALLGSAVLGFAMERGRLGADEACRLSALDAIWQAEQWGEDAEAKARAEAVKAELRALESLFAATAD